MEFCDFSTASRSERSMLSSAAALIPAASRLRLLFARSIGIVFVFLRTRRCCVYRCKYIRASGSLIYYLGFSYIGLLIQYFFEFKVVYGFMSRCFVFVI